jgi:hypothetical protein
MFLTSLANGEFDLIHPTTTDLRRMGTVNLAIRASRRACCCHRARPRTQRRSSMSARVRAWSRVCGAQPGSTVSSWLTRVLAMTGPGRCRPGPGPWPGSAAPC